jgi:hypothetical protein
MNVGNHSIDDYYVGDTNYAGFSPLGITQTVNKASTAVNLSVTPNPAYYGQQVTVQYTFSAVAPSVAVPPGNCTLTIDGSPVTCGTLVNGAASTVFGNGLPTGNRTIAVSYNGTPNFIGISGSTTLTVNKDTPAVKVTSSVNPSVAGQSVTFTASVVPTNISLATTGMVTFSDGANSLGSAILNTNGVATLANAALTVGSHTITAAYGGDGNFNSNAGNLTQVVNSATAPCDLNADGSINVLDIQRIINEAQGASTPADDLSHDGQVNVVDVQREANAILGKGCAN